MVKDIRNKTLFLFADDMIVYVENTKSISKTNKQKA